MDTHKCRQLVAQSLGIDHTIPATYYTIGHKSFNTLMDSSSRKIAHARYFLKRFTSIGCKKSQNLQIQIVKLSFHERKYSESSKRFVQNAAVTDVSIIVLQISKLIRKPQTPLRRFCAILCIYTPKQTYFNNYLSPFLVYDATLVSVKNLKIQDRDDIPDNECQHHHTTFTRKKNQISAKMFVKTKNDLLISHCHLMDIRDHSRATTT